jgi:branched-chain amino acid transport system permease protein
MTNAVIQGLLLGGLYALFATGLSLVFGVMRLVNLAHGDLAVLGAFLGLLFIEAVPVSPFVSLLVVVPVMAVLGYLLQRGLLDASLRTGPLAPLLVTFGLSVILQNLFQEFFSADQRRLNIGSFGTASLHVTDSITLAWFDVLVLVLAVAVLAGLALVLSRTQTGRVIRATADDPEAARASGVDSRHVYALVTGVAVAIVAVAGVLLAMKTTFSPTSGPTRLLFAFEAVVIGGLGSLWGTLAGGLVLGVAQTVGAQIDPAYGILAGHLVFLAVLALRPQGIVAGKVAA